MNKLKATLLTAAASIAAAPAAFAGASSPPLQFINPASNPWTIDPLTGISTSIDVTAKIPLSFPTTVDITNIQWTVFQTNNTQFTPLSSSSIFACAGNETCTQTITFQPPDGTPNLSKFTDIITFHATVSGTVTPIDPPSSSSSCVINDTCGSVVATPMQIYNGSGTQTIYASVNRPDSVPLPSSLILFGSGLGGLALLRRRRKRKKAVA